MTSDGIHISATCVLRQIELLVSWDEILINALRMLNRQHIGDLFAPFWNMAAVFGIPKAWFFNKKSKKLRIGLLGLLLATTALKLGHVLNTGRTKMGVSQEKERQQTDSFVQRSKGWCSHSNRWSYPTPPLPPVRPSRNHHSLTFQTPAARTDIYKGSFFPQTIRNWNALPDSIEGWRFRG